jgi:hypothetical protein
MDVCLDDQLVGRLDLVTGFARGVFQGIGLEKSPRFVQLGHAGGFQRVPKGPGAAVRHGGGSLAFTSMTALSMPRP